MKRFWVGAVFAAAFILSLVTLGFSFLNSKYSSEPETSEPPYGWTRALDPGKPGWPRWVLPIKGKDNKLWMIAEKASWSSSDGLHWDSASHNADTAVRAGVAPAFFKGEFWLIGGMKTWSEFTNEIWHSVDGFHWHKLGQTVPWGPRRNAMIVNFDGKLWLLGGQRSTGQPVTKPYRDVWYTSDGKTWVQVADSAPWGAGSALVFREKIWVVGGGGAWYSDNGRDWIQAANLDALKRTANGCEVFDGKIWVFGGFRDGKMNNDVWASADGRQWSLVTSRAPWFPRGGEYSIAFAGRLWIFGGKTGTHYREADDIWYMTSNLSKQS